MCGFLGLTGNNVNHENFNFSLEKLSHRGPDNTKKIHSNDISIGFKRLAINDLSKNSNQPFDDHSAILAFNGEIYNHHDINLNNNYNVKNNSDALVLFSLIKEKMEKSLDEINGMFSFAFYDKKSKTLFAARDRFGEKPFYYSILNNGDLIFSSEIKAITAYVNQDFDLDLNQLCNYFKNSHVDTNKTIYQKIYSLPPSHYLIYKKGNLEIKKYWKIDFKQKHNFNYIDHKEKIKNLLFSAVEKQIQADVEVGIFLSGGIDSSLILSIASKLKKKISTFSYGFLDADNELKQANELSLFYETKHYAFDDKNVDYLNIITKMQNVFDEPFSDSSCLPLFLLSEKSSNYVKSVITGDGGDEMFLGYSNWYSRIDEIKKYSKINKIPFLNKLINYSDSFNKSSIKKYLNLINHSKNDSELFNYSKSPFNYSELIKLGLLNEDTEKVNLLFPSSDLLSSFRIESINSYLPGNILLKSDRCAMANSLELRSPFLDLNLVNSSFEIPNDHLYKNNQGKIILREILQELGVPSNVSQRKKRGFGAPVHRILSDKKVNEALHDSLGNKNSKIFNYLNFSEVQKDIHNLNQKVWTYFNFDLWLNSR